MKFLIKTVLVPFLIGASVMINQANGKTVVKRNSVDFCKSIIDLINENQNHFVKMQESLNYLKVNSSHSEMSERATVWNTTLDVTRENYYRMISGIKIMCNANIETLNRYNNFVHSNHSLDFDLELDKRSEFMNVIFDRIFSEIDLTKPTLRLIHGQIEATYNFVNDDILEKLKHSPDENKVELMKKIVEVKTYIKWFEKSTQSREAEFSKLIDIAKGMQTVIENFKLMRKTQSTYVKDFVFNSIDSMINQITDFRFLLI